MSARDFDGHEHWCKPISEATGFYCLGVLFSCGHSFDCYRDPAALDHDRVHRGDRWTFILFGLSCYLAFVVWLLADRGVIP